MKEETTNQTTDPKKLLCPKAGTATSSPDVLTTSPTILNVMLWMKKEAYADSTIKATAKRLKHLKKNCLLADPESVKIFVANKKCSNAFKDQHRNDKWKNGKARFLVQVILHTRRHNLITLVKCKIPLCCK